VLGAKLTHEQMLAHTTFRRRSSDDSEAENESNMPTYDVHDLKREHHERPPTIRQTEARTCKLLVAQLVVSVAGCIALIVLVALTAPLVSRADTIVKEYTLVLTDSQANPDAALTPQHLNQAIAEAQALVGSARLAADQAPALFNSFRNISDAVAAADVSSLTASSARIMAKVPANEIAKIIVQADELLRRTTDALDADAIRQLTQRLAETPVDLLENVDRLIIRAEETFAALQPYMDAMKMVQPAQVKPPNTSVAADDNKPSNT